jgi:hypothetical protein
MRRGETCTGVCWENLRERDNWGDNINIIYIILRRIFRIETGGGNL